jgi:hypothetical protein
MFVFRNVLLTTALDHALCCVCGSSSSFDLPTTARERLSVDRALSRCSPTASGWARGLDLSPLIAILILTFLQFAVVQSLKDLALRMN